MIFLQAANIYATPVSDTIEIAAQFCHFSDLGTKCGCFEEAVENMSEENKALKKLKKECCFG